MNTRKLGNSDLHISPVGLALGPSAGLAGSILGTAGRHRFHCCHPPRPGTRRQLDRYCRCLWTRPLGRSRRARIERVARRPPLCFHQVCSELGCRGEDHSDHSAASIRKECEGSLRRLQVDTIDLYQIHWPPPIMVPVSKKRGKHSALFNKKGKSAGSAYPISTCRKSNARRRLLPSLRFSRLIPSCVARLKTRSCPIAKSRELA